LQISELGEG